VVIRYAWRLRLAAGSDVTVTATRIAKPIEMDGRLDDDVYQSVKAITGLLQQEPHEGELTSERTDVWVLFDDKNVYVSALPSPADAEKERPDHAPHNRSKIAARAEMLTNLGIRHAQPPSVCVGRPIRTEQIQTPQTVLRVTKDLSQDGPAESGFGWYRAARMRLTTSLLRGVRRPG
jgi:hypothetical protein